MRKMIIFILMLSFILSGCARVVNPYSSEFECPQVEKGKCVGIQTAYEESIKTSDERNLAREFEKGYDSNRTSFKRNDLLLSPAEQMYVESLYEVMTKLLKDPKTPVVVPPRIVRVLILPYQGSDGKFLYSARYTYVIVEDPKWILENIINYPSAEE